MATVTQDADAAALDPQFPTQTPAGRRSSTPVPPCAPGGQSVPRHPHEEPSVEQSRWTRRLGEERRHVLAAAEVTTAATRGHAPARCGHPLPAEGLTSINDLPAALCRTCLARISSASKDHGPRGSAPFHRRLVRRLSTRSPDATAPDGQPATTPGMR